MLKFFFDRTSFMVRLLNGLCAGLIFWQFSKPYFLDQASHWVFWDVYFAFSWLFFNMVNWIPWYPGFKGKLGIRLHFQKNVVPIAYGTALIFGLRLAGVSWAWLWPVALLWIPIYYVTFILLYFHLKDESNLMPGYFSHNFYYEDEPS